MDVARTLDIKFETRCGEMTAKSIVAGCLALVEGRLAQARVTGQLDTYDVRVSRVPEEVAR